MHNGHFQAYMLNMKHLISLPSVQQQIRHAFVIFANNFSVFSRLRNFPILIVETRVGTLSAFCSVYIIMNSINQPIYFEFLPTWGKYDWPHISLRNQIFHPDSKSLCEQIKVLMAHKHFWSKVILYSWMYELMHSATSK